MGRKFMRMAARVSGADELLQRLLATIAEQQSQRTREVIESLYSQSALSFEERKKIDEIAAVDKQMQIFLSLKYKDLLNQTAPLPRLADVQFRSYSQNGEDGILLYIFSLVGTTSKKAVEICAGNGIECNSANLILNHRWLGLLVDGDIEQVNMGKEFYARHPDTSWLKPTIVHAWVTAENVNELICSNGYGGEIDLLSLDLDGVDYWIWKAIDSIQPRVVVLEYNWIWGASRSVTIPYRPDYVNADPGGVRGGIGNRYFGGSLPAFVKLGREKGYRLIGCEGWGFNAFFLRNDVGADILPEIEASECFEIPVQQYVRHPKILDVMDPGWEWVEV
jgi:hypothetical protein